MAESRGIDDEDVRWMRRDLVSSLLGVQWFTDGGRPTAASRGRMVESVLVGVGWGEDRMDEADRLLVLAVDDVGIAASWARLVDRIAELAEEQDDGVIDSDRP